MRFQINATKANNVCSRITPETVEAVRGVMAAVPTAEFILQRNEETRPLWEPLLAAGLPPNASLLFDDSVGTGVLAKAWPAPPEAPTKFGYAGGLGPANLGEQLRRMVEVVGASEARRGDSFWVDMESSLRTILADGTDLFDVNKCVACAIQATSVPGFAVGK